MLTEPLASQRQSKERWVRQVRTSVALFVVGAAATLAVMSLTHMNFAKQIQQPEQTQAVVPTLAHTITSENDVVPTLAHTITSENDEDNNKGPVFQADQEVTEVVGRALSFDTVERIDTAVGKLVSFGTRHTGSATNNPNYGIGAARDWIKSEFETFSPNINVEFDFFWLPPQERLPNGANTTNVVARLPGSDSTDTRIIMISGHYDSRNLNPANFVDLAPGANDDASGTVLAMEAARIMSRYSFPCTLLFVAFTAEEQGLLGARDLASKMRQQNANLIAVLNNDIVGGERSSSETGLDDPHHIRVFSIPGTNTGSNPNTNDSPQRLLSRYIADMADTYLADQDFRVKMGYRQDRFLRGGDQNAFNDFGFSAVRFTEMNENYLHQHEDVRVVDGVQHGDLQEFMRSDYVSRVLAVNLATAASLAWAPGAPRSVRLTTSTLSNLSELTWLAPLHGASRVFQYIVLVRENSASRWDPALTQRVAAGTLRAVLPMTKDNFLFAVASVDQFGRASLPVFQGV